MAKWGFDLDGTLDKPEIRDLANLLFAAGEEVHILTGFVPNGGYNEEMKIAKIRRLGVRCTRVHLCEGETNEDIGYTKAQVLNNNNINFMVDDDPVFVRQMAYYSAACLLMVVKGAS